MTPERRAQLSQAAQSGQQSQGGSSTGVLGKLGSALKFAAKDILPGGPKPQAPNLAGQIFQSTLGSKGAAGLLGSPATTIKDAAIGKIAQVGADPKRNAELSRVNEALSAKAGSLPEGDPKKAELLRQVFENTQMLGKGAQQTRDLTAQASLPAGQDSTGQRIANVAGQSLNTAATFAPIPKGLGVLKTGAAVGSLAATQSVGTNLQEGADPGKIAKDAAISFATAGPLAVGGSLLARGVSKAASKVAPTLEKGAETAYRRTYPLDRREIAKVVNAKAGAESPLTTAKWALGKGLKGNPIQQATQIRGITDKAVKGMTEVAKNSPVTTKVTDPGQYRSVLKSIIGGFDDSLDQEATGEGQRLLKLLNKDNELWERPELLDFKYLRENADDMTVGQLMNAIKAKGGDTNFIPTGINPATKLDNLAFLSAEDTVALRRYIDKARTNTSFKLNPSLSNKQDAYRAISDELRGTIRKNYPDMVPFLDDYHYGTNAMDEAITKAVKEGNQRLISGLEALGAGGLAAVSPLGAGAFAVAGAASRGASMARPASFLGRQLQKGANVAKGVGKVGKVTPALLEAAKKAVAAAIANQTNR